jgi:superfamily II DNA or RNA helicase
MEAGARPLVVRRVPSPWPATRPLRAWQAEALHAVLALPHGDFLAAATPAAGKTTFGLRVAHALMTSGRVARVAIVAPTAHICRQWAADAARVGLDLDPNRANADGPEPLDRDGLAITYQAVAAGAAVHRRACAARPTLLIADEPHHMGEEAAWGRSAAAAFGSARLRLLLSGTPFRSDSSAIPWIDYDENDVSRSDYEYGYTQALLDGVCRPITFLAYDGEMEWVAGGRRRAASFATALPRAESARRLRTALEADGDFMGGVLRDADARLTEVRGAGHADAGGLVVAADKAHARRLAARLTAISGEPAEVVTSDDPGASAHIDAFARGRARWLVSVLMVSEGVDVPRLRVGVYATAARTELFFRQVVGRFVRRTPRPERQMSFLLLPADPILRALAAKVEEERRHALEQRSDLEVEPPAERAAPGEGFLALSSSAHLEEVIRSTTQPGDALSLFGEPTPAAPAPEPAASAPVSAGSQAPAYILRERERERRTRLVALLARRTGEEHAAIHARTNAATGASSVPDATHDQLREGNARLERELGRVRRGRAPLP